MRDQTSSGRRYAWAVVALLTAALTVSMIDRMLLVLLVGPIKARFGLSDTEIGLLNGLGFTILYVVMGLPMGRLADRYSRRVIIGFSVLAWSAMTVACGLATSVAMLFLARVGVGIGEAGLSPAANSMIADYFPPERLSAPIAFFSIGGSAGTGLAFILGGAAVDYVSAIGTVSLPVLGVMEAWQLAFIVVGLPGALLAACFLLVREPERRGAAYAGQPSVRAAVEFVGTQRAFLVPHCLASAMAALVAISIHSWMPTLLNRLYGLSPGSAGVAYGTVVLVCGVGGLVMGGTVAGRLSRRGVSDAHIRVALTCAIAGTVPAVLSPLAGSIGATLALAGASIACFATAIALAPVALQIAVPNEYRGQVYAGYLLILSLLGYAVGPIAVAAISDHALGGEAMLGPAIALVAGAGGSLSAIFFTLSRRAYAALPAAPRPEPIGVPV